MALYRRELLPWLLVVCTPSLVESATAAVLIKRTFADAVPREALNPAVAFVSGSPALGMAGTAALAAYVMENRPRHAMLIYGAAGFAGLAAAWFARRVRVRQSFRLRRAELTETGSTRIFSLRIMREILERDPEYRRFMTCIVPLLCMPLFTPLWARMFDSGHVIAFRAHQCWATVAGMAVMIVAVYSGQQWLLWCAALLFGVATAGAHLGWNLGHNDFASLGKVQQYMGVNVTLTGMRGLIAPPVGAIAYTLLERRAPGAGRVAQLLPLGMSLAGAIGFNRMQHNRTGSETA